MAVKIFLFQMLMDLEVLVESKQIKNTFKTV